MSGALKGRGGGGGKHHKNNNAVQNPKELVWVVDESNTVLGSATRSEMREKNLIHRCSYVMILNDNKGKELFVQKRVDFKETYPSLYDPAPGGVVGCDESYEENALREIEEEMGISGVELKRHFDFLFEDEFSRVWGRLFSCTYRGPFTLQEEEVESAQFLKVETVKQLIKDNKVCPDSALALTKFFASESPDHA
jgi:isopentenyl-diphosphate delta-isomerase